METERNPTSRLVAIGAVGATFLAFVLVIALSLGGGQGDSAEQPSTPPSSAEESATEPAGGAETETTTTTATTGRASYVVKPGDSLVLISEKTGVSVETLQTLNPDLDPQALTSGQRVRLRE